MDFNALYTMKELEKQQRDENNLGFSYPLAIDKNESLENLDYNYDEINTEEIDEEFINEIDNFKYQK